MSMLAMIQQIKTLKDQINAYEPEEDEVYQSYSNEVANYLADYPECIELQRFHGMVVRTRY